MKKILTSLALLGVVSGAAYAQRTIDVEVRLYPPQTTDGTLIETLTNCSAADSFVFGYDIINHGPDNIVAGDSVFIQDPESETSSNVWYFVLSEGINVGDTANLYAGMSHYDMTNVLYTSDGTTIAPSDAPFADGEYVYAVIFDRLSGEDGVVATDPNDTNNIAGALITMEACTNGIGSLTGLEKSDLTIFPNPATSIVNVTYNFNATTSASIRISDITGRVVLSQDLGKQTPGAQQFSIDVNALNNGIYSIELITDQERAISKLTISK